MTVSPPVYLVYDGECPVCTMYCRRVRLQEAAGTLHLVDARQPSALMDEVTAAGLDIDQGMALKLGNRLYYGPEAMQVLTLMTTPAGWFNRLSYLFFSTPGRAGFWYPVGKAFRTAVLKLCGIRSIENLKKPSGKPPYRMPTHPSSVTP